MALDTGWYFRIEARELLANLTKGALALEQAPGDRATVVRLLRFAHTLKGAARVAGEEAIARLAHATEDVLARARDREEPLSAEGMRALLASIDAIAERLAATEPRGEDAADATPEVLDVPTVRVEVREMDALLEGFAQLGVHLAGLRAPLAALDEAQRAVHELEVLLRESAARFEDGAPALPRLVPALDALSAAIERCRDGVDVPTRRADAQLAFLRDRARGMRLLPVGVLFPVLERAVRDAAAQLGKRVLFVSSGADVRLDSPVHELLRDALLQLARNAVAHGVEAPAARAAAGKSPTGTVRVSVERADGDVRLTFADDGAGIDLDAVAREAVARGRIAPGEPISLPRAVDLLTEGGLSTTRTADLTSGRGVGLNLVRWAVQQARGRMTVRSDRGRGTTVEIRVPATLLAITALRVEAAGRPCWIPAEGVVRADRASAAEIAREDGRAAFDDRGATIPLVSLRALLGGDEGLAPGQGTMVVVVADGPRRVAVAVDHLVGLRAIVAQPLPRGIADGGLVAYATLDPEGCPELVLDPAVLVQAPPAVLREAPAPTAPRLPL
ncbi:MAG: chemotaxis protein CheA, partial [Myxococcota bacterium]